MRTVFLGALALLVTSTACQELNNLFASGTTEDNPVVDRPAGVLLQEDFGDNKRAWHVADKAAYSAAVVGGIYSLSVQEDGHFQGFWSNQSGIFTDMGIRATITKTSGPDNLGYGIMARIDPDTKGKGKDKPAYYLFQINGKGRYRLVKNTGGAWVETLMPWRSSDAIVKGGGQNTLEIMCEGSTLKLYVNGVFLESVEDPGPVLPMKGRIGFAANGPMDITVDDVVVYEL